MPTLVGRHVATAAPTLPPAARLPLLLLGLLSLVGGVLAGLARLGIDVPTLAAAASGQHGALMIAAFFGTVIGLERAVALGHPAWYLAPAGSALGGIAVLAGDARLGALLCLGGGGVFFAGSVQVARTLPALFTLTLAAGALALPLGNLVWFAHGAPAEAMPLWFGSLVLTVAGERLELTRLMPPQPGARKIFVALLAAFALTAPFAAVSGEARPLAAVLLCLAVWLLRNDVARRTVRGSGLPRFVAVALLSGYFMLAVSAALGVAGAYAPGHIWRDAAVHALLLGFVFAMVVGHAPVIFPAVMKVRIPYHPAFYMPLLLLQASLLLRMAGGLLDHAAWRDAGALGNAAALALLVATLLARVASGRREITP